MPKTLLVPSHLRGWIAGPRLPLVASLAVLTAAAHLLLPEASDGPPRRSPSPQLTGPLYAATAPLLRDSLSPGETLSDVWDRQGRGSQEMAEVVLAANAVYDVRQLRSGTTVELFVAAPEEVGAGPAGIPLRGHAAVLDSVRILIDADRTLALRAASTDRATFLGELREVPVRYAPRTYVGCIEGSLYAALERDGEDFSALALELDRIYGGLIDFHGDLHPGDCVALHFDTYVRPDGSLRLGRVHAAELVNRGARHAAIWFEAPDGTADYYDLVGKSLRRQFLRSPLKFTRISSGYTLRRFHPILKRYRAHPAIDYVAPAGTPVQAAGKGVVAFAGWSGGYGRLVRVRHGKVYETYYAHLSRIPRGIRPGARVAQGEIIGYVGSSGLSTAPHLDYRFAKNGRFVNPLAETLPAGEPVSEAYVTLFADRRDQAMQVLGEAYRTALVEEPGGSATAEAPLAATQPGGWLGGVGDD